MLIPGFTVLFISEDSVYRILSTDYIGYRTKITVLVLIAFVIGFTLTTFLQALLGGIGGAIGAAAYKPPHTYTVAPWRDPRWRQLVKQKLGTNCPNDTRPISPPIFDLREKLIANLPPERRQEETLKLNQEKLSCESDDLAWTNWYDHYHKIIVLPEETDLSRQIHSGLRFSLEVAGLCYLIGTTARPAVRHWWFIVPASLWVALLIIESIESARKTLNKWSSLNEQIRYLVNN